MNSIFFRLNYPSHAVLGQLVASTGLAGLAPELAMKLRPGHFVLAARYDASGAFGTTRAMGRVIANTSQLEIEWRITEFDLHPSAQGQQQWKREHFCFDRAVAQRYGLPDRASRLFPDAPLVGRVVADDGSAVGSDDPGYVYVIRSQYGFKIGKTRHLHDRTRLFGVKLPFPIDVELSGWCRQYSATERALHVEFAQKRLEGEWFALNDADLESLRMRFAQTGPPA